MPITALPAPPQRNDPATFADRGDALLGALPQFVTEANALEANVNAKESSAATSATNAATSAMEAATSAAIAVGSAGAVMWVSGTTYAFGDVRWSPVDGLVYRRMIAGAGTVDPGLDSENWVGLSSLREVDTPSNITPANGTTGVLEKQPTLSAGAFASLYGATHLASQWQVSTSTSFAAPLYSSGDQAAATSFQLPDTVLAVSTTYYWRVRYRNSTGTYSAWSAPTSFATAMAFLSYIDTPTATPAAFGDAFEGGFYTGMIWNELVQSSTSTTIATGSKTFTVPSMTGAPIVYEGQQLEVRSRADPYKKMAGTVTFAAGTVLTLNITSVGGSGTFTDWSIMSRYRVIVAPKASGENVSIAIKNYNTALPTACITLSEGRKATLAMVAADTSTVYPAAHWCNNLSIGGKTDWYLPARDEAELWCRNLKPSASDNYTTSDRPVSGSSYATFGSPGDTSTNNGNNGSSAPSSPGNTLTVPGQVSAGKGFRTGESEAFAAVTYRTCTEHSTTQVALQYFESGGISRQNAASKTSNGYVRAVRRSII